MGQKPALAVSAAGHRNRIAVPITERYIGRRGAPSLTVAENELYGGKRASGVRPGVRAYTGEGLVGLSWAFLRAGAHNVIGALWEVSDDSTPYLMDHFYDSLTKGQPPDEALRSAKLALLHSKGIFRKPFYWAPFQLYVRS